MGDSKREVKKKEILLRNSELSKNKLLEEKDIWVEEKKILSTELQKERWQRKEAELKLKQLNEESETQKLINSRRFFHIKRPDRELLEMRHDALANNIISNLYGPQP